MKEQKEKSESDGKIVTPEEVKGLGMKSEVGTKEVKSKAQKKNQGAKKWHFLFPEVCKNLILV